MRHTREKVKSILINWWKKPRFNSHLATISHDKNVYIYIYIDYLTMLIARMNSIRIVLWGLGLMPFDTINRTCSFFRKSARRIETNYRTCVSQLFPRKISFCDRINSYLSNKSIHDQRVSSVRSISLRGIRRSKTGAGRIALSQHRFKFNRREKTACTRN